MVPSKELLLIDDDAEFLESLHRILSDKGYAIRSAKNAYSAMRQFDHYPPDLILLDIDLPEINGFEILTSIRSKSNIPVLIVSGDKEDTDKVKALHLGADDYITKPFNPEELLARISAVLRRVEWTPPMEPVLEVGPIHVDMATRQVHMDDGILHLTPIEYAMLCTLMQNAGRIVTHEDLLTSVWGPGYEGDFSVLRVNISRLRQKIEKNPRRPLWITTVPRKGYMIPSPTA
jgi:two-component system KDP operon response regulator KdpE